MASQTPDKPKQTRKPKEEHLCHVHDECESLVVDDVRKKVCRDLTVNKHTNGKNYCILHFPSKDKNKENAFEKLFQTRLKETDDLIAEIETKFPDDKDKRNTIN